MANTRARAKQVTFKSDATGGAVRNLHDKLSETVSVKDFGAVGDGVTDDTAAIQAALNAAGVGGRVFIPPFRYKVNSDLNIPLGCSLVGGNVNHGGDNFFGQNWFDNLRTLILLSSTATINVNASSSVENIAIFRSDITTVPVADSSAFAGTAITLGNVPIIQSYDTCVKNCLICGFNIAINGLRVSNALIEKVMIDCNMGIKMDTGGNPILIKDCLGWPFLTVAYTPFVSTQLNRSGDFIRLQNNVDASKIITCTAFDYTRGIVLDSANGVEIIGCGMDAPDNPTSVGLETLNATGLTQVTNCQFVANNIGVRNGVGSVSDVLLLTNCYFTANLTADIECANGTTLVGGQSHFSSNINDSILVSNVNSVLVVDDINCNKTTGQFIQNALASSNISIGNLVRVVGGSAVYGGAALVPSVASAGSMRLPMGAVIDITGTANIFGFTGGWPGRVVSLRFADVLTLSDSGGMNLAGNFTTSPNDILTLAFTSATQCYEIGRSVN